jgi:hypothetical protein
MGNRIEIENLREYRPDGPDGVYAANFENVCPKCEKRHEQGGVDTGPIMVVTVKAPCGFTAPVPLPVLEPE